jgi:hypothetical protein
MDRRDCLKLSLLSCALPGRLLAQEPDYRSPYRLKYRHPIPTISAGFEEPPWKSNYDEAMIPHAEWFTESTRRRWGAWGPPARQYPSSRHVHNKEQTFLQDRVILAASKWIGLSYQHHHVPDWYPPANWPWKKVSLGRNAPGIDCSNFSSFYYNYALGIKLDTAIVTQAERLQVRGPGGEGRIELERVEPKSYDDFALILQPADLLYIRNKSGKLAHVVMWLGVVGEGPDKTPLVIDSTGEGHRDSNGKFIPSGIQIRPFGPKSWYFHDFAHAHRIIPALAQIKAGKAGEPTEGGAEIR